MPGQTCVCGAGRRGGKAILIPASLLGKPSHGPSYVLGQSFSYFTEHMSDLGSRSHAGLDSEGPG